MNGVMRYCGSERQIRERKPSKAWAAKIAALKRPIIAVTVSIISIYPSAPARAQNDIAPYTVKKIPDPNRRSEGSDDLMQQVSAAWRSDPNRKAATACLPIDDEFCFRAASPHFRRVPTAICLSLGAEAGCTWG
jgi:hypothetical protein